MEFPVYFWLGPLKVHPHALFELLAYSLGFQLYRQRAKHQPVATSSETRMWLLVACVLGAALGAKGLGWLETPFVIDPVTGARQWLAPGKTITGGLLGGWAGIEIAKRRLGITASTGDAYVWPIIVGLSLGRLGCFFTGLEDHTYGVATTLPWAIDFGDGILRHPTQLYEIIWLLLTGLILRWVPAAAPGTLFRWMMTSYLFFRLLVEIIKPTLHIYGGLSAIQVAALIGLGVCLSDLYRLYSLPSKEPV